MKYKNICLHIHIIVSKLIYTKDLHDGLNLWGIFLNFSNFCVLLRIKKKKNQVIIATTEQ